MASNRAHREESDPRRGRQPRCPVCGGAAEPQDAAFPFCSPRCRRVDLARWFGEDYRLGRPAEEDDLD